ncbi:MAG: DUF4392 domain-containing protein [Desulfarculaceae bacterium]|jgi:hypothetical protein
MPTQSKPYGEDSKKLKLFKTIDHFMTLDLTGLGLVVPLYQALGEVQPGNMCQGASEMITRALPQPGGLALIATGFPMGAGLPETDGPVGAALLARALLKSRGAPSILITDAGWEQSLKAACVGAGLTPLEAPSARPEKIHYLNEVYIKTVPKEAEPCHAVCDQLLEIMRPGLLVAVERPGQNLKGVCHGLNGRSLEGMAADLDYLFSQGQKAGIPSLAVADGGNEIGMGLIKQALPGILPQGVDCGCPCGGGITAQTACDHLVVASVSNWGVSGIIAALALSHGDLGLLHSPGREIRTIEMCANAGAVDGGSLSPDPAVDGVPAWEWEGLLRSLKGALYRGLGLDGDWRRAGH